MDFTQSKCRSSSTFLNFKFSELQIFAQPDESFRKAVRGVMEKNAELYRRLS